MNPAITLAMFASEKITLLRTIFYIIAQSGGAIAGAALIFS
jgi:glycerol uptake facilitator-like aquaporin